MSRLADRARDCAALTPPDLARRDTSPALFLIPSESLPYARHNLNLSLPLTLPFSSLYLSLLSPPSLVPPLPRVRLFTRHSLAASLMSVLSRGPPFHTAALTITSITSNYLAVFPLPRPIAGIHLAAGIICVSDGCHRAPNTSTTTTTPTQRRGRRRGG